MSLTIRPLVLAAVLLLSVSCHGRILPGFAAPDGTPMPPPTPTPSSGCSTDLSSVCWTDYQNCYNTNPQNSSNVCTCFAQALKCTYQAGCFTPEVAQACVDGLDSGAIQDCPVSICDPSGAVTPTITATPPPGCQDSATECTSNFTDCVTAAGGDFKSVCECSLSMTNCLYSRGCWVGVDVEQCEQGMSSLKCHDYGIDPCNPGTSVTSTPVPGNCEGPKISHCEATFEQCVVKTGSNTTAMCPCLGAGSVCLEAAGCYSADLIAACQSEATRLSCGNVCMAPPTPTPSPDPKVCDPQKAGPLTDVYSKCVQAAGASLDANCKCLDAYVGGMDDAFCWTEQAAESCASALGKTCAPYVTNPCHTGSPNQPTSTPIPIDHLFTELKTMLGGDNDVTKVRAKFLRKQK